MKQVRFSFMIFIPIVLLLVLITGCKLFSPEGEYQVFGTATINGKNYKDGKTWRWNYQPESPPLAIRTYYKCFDFQAQLNPEESGLPNYAISFFITMNGNSVKAPHSYKLGHYKELNVSTFNYRNVIPYLSENKSTILPAYKDGIAFAFEANTGAPISLAGEFVIEEIYEKTNICIGSYSLATRSDSQKKLAIEGKFEAKIYTTNFPL